MKNRKIQSGEVTTEKGKAGRPKKEINLEQFEKLCSLFPTIPEVASFFDVSEDTLIRRLKEAYNSGFSELLDRFGGKGKLSLRRIMWKHAQKSPAVAIFMAKNYLGMTDQPKEDNIQIDEIVFIEEYED